MLMVATGFTMLFSAELGFSKGLVGSVKEIHELAMWFFVVFAGGHLLGMSRAGRRGAVVLSSRSRGTR